MPPKQPQPRELILISKASDAVAQARTIDEIKDLRDKAEAVRAYAKKARLGKHIVIEASAIKVHAERKLGRMLGEVKLAHASPGNQYTGRVDRSHEQDGPVRLADLGITKSDSSRSQQIALLPDHVFDGYVADSMRSAREPTTAGLLRLAKQRRAKSDSKQPPPRGVGVVSTFRELTDTGRRFATIYADPPWPYNNQATRAAASNHYPTMSIEQIRDEPVAQVCEDRAHLHLWTTNAFLSDAFDVIDSWGFTYKSCFVWIKPQIGLGNYWRVSHEFLLLGVRGKLAFQDKTKRSWIEADRTKHSQKPAVVRQLIEQVSPAPYLEMYGRQAFPGSEWTVYGNQVQRSLS